MNETLQDSLIILCYSASFAIWVFTTAMIATYAEDKEERKQRANRN